MPRAAEQDLVAALTTLGGYRLARWQVVVLITTQQGAEIRAEVARWLPAHAVMEVGIHGLTPAEGRALVEAVITRPLADTDWGIVQEIGERVGWHPEALRLAATEGREIGWQGMLDEMHASRMPWIEIKRLVMRQWTRLHPDQQEWLSALLQGTSPGAWFASDEAAQAWDVDIAIADRRLWTLKGCGVIAEDSARVMGFPRWRVSSVACQVLIWDTY